MDLTATNLDQLDKKVEHKITEMKDELKQLLHDMDKKIDDKLTEVSASISSSLTTQTESIDKMNVSVQSLLESPQMKMEFTDELKEKIKNYMMKNHNIRWVDDGIEENVYDVILSIIFSALKKFGL